MPANPDNPRLRPLTAEILDEVDKKLGLLRKKMLALRTAVKAQGRKDDPAEVDAVKGVYDRLDQINEYMKNWVAKFGE